MKTIFGVHEPNTLAQFEDVSSRAVHSVLCADGHYGYIQPVGATTAYRGKVSIAAVGFDIGCGTAAIMTNLKSSAFDKRRLHELANEIQNTISFGMGRKNNANDAPLDDPLFSDPAWDAIPLSHRASLWGKAQVQLGSCGSGNHFLDIFADEQDRIWIGNHFGSRGLGHTIASGFMALLSGEEWDKRVPEVEGLIALDTPMGDAYWQLMSIAGRYAYIGREWVLRKTLSIIGGEETDLVHNWHNFAWKETHFDEELIVVRKGATPAFPGQRGFVGGSMGDNSVILEGVDSPSAPSALYSTVHGAGRVMGRQDAIRGKAVRDADGKVISRDESTKITQEMQKSYLDDRGVILRGGGVDEDSRVYKKLPEVLAAQGGTIKILHQLRPLIVLMAGKGDKDLYKD